MKIERGEIYLVDFNPNRGSEQAGIRPALIIQNDIGNEYSNTTIVLAISSSVKNNPTNIQINPDLKNNLDNISVVKTSQILTIDKIRLIKYIGKISTQDLQKIDESLKISLGLN